MVVAIAIHTVQQALIVKCLCFWLYLMDNGLEDGKDYGMDYGMEQWEGQSVYHRCQKRFWHKCQRHKMEIEQYENVGLGKDSSGRPMRK